MPLSNSDIFSLLMQGDSNSSAAAFILRADSGIIDVSGNGLGIQNNGVYTSSAQALSGHETSFRVDSTKGLTISDVSNLHDLFARGFTAQGWFWFDTSISTSGCSIFGKIPVYPPGSGLYKGWLLSPFFNQSAYFNYAISTTTNSATIGGGSTSKGVWVHFAVVFTPPRNVKVFRNGTLIINTTLSSCVEDNVTPFFVGGRNNQGYQNGYFSGYFDELALYPGRQIWTANFTPPLVAP